MSLLDSQDEILQHQQQEQEQQDEEHDKQQQQQQQQQQMQKQQTERGGGQLLGVSNSLLLEQEDNEKNGDLLYMEFNQDGSCLALGTTAGFRIAHVYPDFVPAAIANHTKGGIALVAMLYRCNVMGLVGGGPSPQTPPNRVVLWDDVAQRGIGQLSFRQMVLRVLLRRDAIVVVLRDRIYIYHLATLRVRDKIYTSDNGNGLCSISHGTTTTTTTTANTPSSTISTVNASNNNTTNAVLDMVVACPSVRTGQVRVEVYHARKTILVEAHEGPLKAIALTHDGTRLATASDKGTIIRVFNVTHQAHCLTPLFEFRRGVERASICNISFSSCKRYLATCSNKGTAHVFDMMQDTAGSNTTDFHQDGHSVASSFWNQLAPAVIMKRIKTSVAQIRGIPYPKCCSFVADRPHPTLALAGCDNHGNAVILLSEFASLKHNVHEEPKRVAYHVALKASTTSPAAITTFTQEDFVHVVSTQANGETTKEEN